MVEKRMKIDGHLDQIERIGRFIQEAAQDAGFDEMESYACELAVCEACENIIVHGYGDDSTGEIEVAVQTEPDKIAIELWDDARPFDPANISPKLDRSLDDPPVGGLGLVIMHKVMDEMEYHRREGRNLLRMRRSRKSPA
ncbi:MAG: ATP-binding protein [Anaerolineales bacterium]|nr:ATP-binding protein [Anaerolineales bacterium]